MKINKILSASVLAAAVLLSATACSTTNADHSPEASSSAQAKTVANPADRAAITRTVTDYYSYVSNPSNLAGIEKASDPIQGDGKSATNEELQALVEALPLGFKYFDTSSPDLIKNAYVQLTMGARVMSQGAAHLDIPADSVTVEGDTAAVDMSKTKATLNGTTIEVLVNSGVSSLKLKKNDKGSWVIISEGVRGLSTGNGFAAALTGAKTAK